MQNVIKKLHDHVINKIAAGEVVERPASVVKELVENSIDAQSTRIIISIKDGGKKLIKVTDNGCGIEVSQLKQAVARHTTSKIVNFDDVYRLNTKGFRGEALASICSVAQVSIGSQVKGQDASEIIVEGGKFIDQRACAQADGTTVTVKYLFYQTPARLKFLKTASTETSHIVDIVTKMALSHPAIAFTLLQNDKSLLEVKAKQSLKERCVSLLGQDLSEYLYSFSSEVAGMKAEGYLSHPQIARTQRFQTHFFVNGRAVNDKVLWHATMEAYRDLIMRGKYPVLVLNLRVDENTIDVNVHPQKTEIRFHQSQQVHHFVCQTLRKRLNESPWMQNSTSHTDLNCLTGPSTSYQVSLAPQKEGIQDSLNIWKNKYFNSESKPPTNDFKDDRQKNIKFGRTKYSEMNPIGQLLGTYILCETTQELILIDQHAAHERIGFEKLLIEFKKGRIPAHPLLIPETFDLKPSDSDILKKYLDEFNHFGIEIEYFGGQTFVIKAFPDLLEGKVEIVRFLTDIIDDIKETGELVSLKDKLHHVLATMACHAQVRASHHLTITEINSLLKELDEYQFTDFCPHGRPVSVTVTKEDIEKWFKRTL